MRTFLFIYLLSFLLTELSGQIITGFVSDELTHRKISRAVIFFDGTFHGTTTDIHGNFTFDISDYPLMPVTVSSSGYYSSIFEVVPSDKPLEIMLKPKVPETIELSGTGDKDEERKRYLKQFKNIILGKTHNALSCEIVNENDITFTIEKNIVKAYTSEPLLIHNEALGYKSSYYLDNFTLNTEDESFFYSGNILFNEDMATDKAGNKKYIKKRGEAYLNSRTYFFRLLWADRLDSEGFIVKNALNEDMYYKDIVIDSGVKGKYLRDIEKMKSSGKEFSTYIVFLENEAVYDAWGRLDISCITEITLQDDIYFDENGYFDPTDISWNGKLAKQRIADQLPLEYHTIVPVNTQHQAPAQHLKPHSAPSHLTPNSRERRGLK